MDSGEEAISEEYESSLEDLTFNSKPLINVLTMLAEENSQFASSITKLIANRICQVQQQYKLPSLYLLDSIVKNVGGDYLHLVAQILEEAFTCVFEKADEKIRRDLYKLRHTWSPYFPAKLLYELDVAVNKHDPGWPIPSVPPPSPSIHVNPKFLKKTDSTGGVASLTTEISTPQEHQVVEGHQQRLVELERLQQEQLKLTELEIQEHQMKRDLLIKKQQQERKLLLQQQQQDILRLRLNTDDSDPELSNGPPDLTGPVPVSTKAESTESIQKTLSSRDPRLRRSDKGPDRIQESRPAVVEDMFLSEPVISKERTVVDNQDSLPLPMNSLQFEQTSGKPPEHVTLPQQNKEVDQNQGNGNPQHMTFVEKRVKPVVHLDRKVTGSPKYGDIQRESKPKHNHRRRNSGDWPSHPAGFENFPDEPPVPKAQVGRGKPRKTRRRSGERQRERGRGVRDRGHERNRGLGNERFENDQRVSRVEQTDSRYAGDRPVDSSSFRGDWKSDVEYRDENFRPHSEPPPRRGKWRRGKTVYVRGSDHDEIMRARSPGITEQRVRGMAQERDRLDNMEPQFPGREIHQDPDFRMTEEKHFHPREQNHPAFRNDSRDLLVGEPLPKKPRPLLSDMEINELRNRKGASPNTGRKTPPLMLQEGFGNHPEESGEHPFPHHVDDPFHPGFGPPPHGLQHDYPMHGPPEEHGGEWAPGFEIPRELMLDRENEIMRRAERRLQSGDLTVDQHHDLMDKLHQLYDLQRQSELMRHPPDVPPQHPEHHPRHMIPNRPGIPSDIELPPEADPDRPMLPVYEEHARIPHRGPAPMDPQGPPMRHECRRLEASESHMGRRNEDFRGHAMDIDQHSHGRPMPFGPGEPPIRFEDPQPPQRDGGSNPMFPRGRALDEIPAPRTPPRQDRGGEITPQTPNTMMEKKAVDDLFRKLMQVGIIKVTPEPGSESPQRVPSPGPPQAELQQPQPLPTRPVSEVLPILAAVMPKKNLPTEKKIIPEIKLVPEELKRRHDGVISSLYEGTQCSSCGLRFPGEAAKIYREHLDWHFRKNRREKGSKRVAHRQWYFVVKDWLSYEEISDPDERASSSFFAVSTGAADSPDPLKEVKDSVRGDGSCPVLSSDTTADAECDICYEKFEQFWEETNEEWHYKAAVRVDGKTYHLLCYQDAKENQGHTEDDDNDLDNEADDSMDAGVDQTAPSKEEAEIHITQAGNSKDEPKSAEKKEASENNALAKKTDQSVAKSSEKDSCNIKGVGIEEENGSVSLFSNVVENKENEIKSDNN